MNSIYALYKKAKKLRNLCTWIISRRNYRDVNKDYQKHERGAWGQGTYVYVGAGVND